ncbi:GDSL-type esterase/lipase family protein [Streptococcus parauberis]|uniref:GDSL-type esterase/lipase family protein n=1 Tax=Streptococcus parauberis TaxID=1348 RepID=UPI00020CBDBA|nr:GDSL-type esterase/lipase family protein [Streptococcus parauberis]AEF25667.1 esterase [Streptococcus parauberis KCTC 11537]UWM90132.1 GDSL-type esterase/lipase family protein [Streptococcus parauberis]WEM63576.1 GDSL-type esterase/lipase family protein [Streptococcus parauberis]GAJ61971.1 esterase [Streptococcus parauberis]
MKIHVTGDSLMARHEDADIPMVNIKLYDLDPTLKVTNSAISGNSTRDLLARYDDIIMDTQSEYLFVLVGTNDLSIDRDVSPLEFEKNLNHLIDIFETRFVTQRIHFLLPPPVDEAKQKKRTNQRLVQYGQLITKVCQEKDCCVLDLNQAFRDAATPEVSLEDILVGIKDDGLHFGEKGYEILAKTINGALKRN